MKNPPTLVRPIWHDILRQLWEDGKFEVLGDLVVATALLNRLFHHAVVIQIEGSSYRPRQHADLVNEHVRSKAVITRSPAPKRRGRPTGRSQTDHDVG